MSRRARRFRTALVSAVLAVASPAVADDPAPQPAPETKPPAAEAKPAVAAKPVPESVSKLGPGERIRVRLKNAGTVEGVILAKTIWERRDVASGWNAVKITDRGAGVRLWYVGDLDGYQFVLAEEIAEVKSLGAVTPEELQAIEKRRQDAAKAAEDERKRLASDRAYVADASEKAKALVAEVEKARLESQALSAVEAKRKLDEGRAKRWADLLAKYPPEKWSLDTPKEIEQRKIVMKVFPSDEELAFLKVYEEWREAVLALKAAQEMANKGSAK